MSLLANCDDFIITTLKMSQELTFREFQLRTKESSRIHLHHDSENLNPFFTPIQISMQPLSKSGCKESHDKAKIHLIGLVVKDSDATYTALLLTVSETSHNNPNEKGKNWTVNDEFVMTKHSTNELRIHVLPSKCSGKEKYREESESHKHRIILLSLQKSVTIYDIQCSIKPEEKLQVLNQEILARNFWWAQWVPLEQCLALAHSRTVRQSSLDDEEVSTKQIFSVLQFHDSYPRESVLNMPVELDAVSVNYNGRLVANPNVLTNSPAQIRLLTHPSGAVYIFHLLSSKNPCIFKYSINILHHNKTLEVTAEVVGGPIKTDVCVHPTDEYVIVVGYPAFVHLLDIGATHEPSHHLLFDYSAFAKTKLSPFLCLSTCRNLSDNHGEEKVDQSSKSSVVLITEDLSQIPILLTSSFFLPLMRGADIRFKMAVLHHFLIHSGDLNVAKRIIYEEGKQGNVNLKDIYQDFLIGYAHFQTKRQILPNMDSFVYLLPYSSNPDSNYSMKSNGFKTDISLQDNQTEVTSMLLSPTQRVFPHNTTDVWVALWQLNRQFSKSKRFNHKNVAEKLLLSLQCYKPEALSRASTPGPMSPSSPLVCNSLGDIAGMFGRRATELQLPFVEHESCTANKQEYIFSINLRELSMHLLKERKEWPLHGHTVAGKYVCALSDTGRLLCHLLCLTVHLPQPSKGVPKGFPLIDSLDWPTKLKLFMLMEHYSVALGTLACPLPHGFTPFFAYLGYRVLKYDQFLWHVRSGTFDIQIDLVKTIMSDMEDSVEENVAKKLQLLSLLPKTRATRVLNSWSHPTSICIRARQHASDLLSGVVSQNRKRMLTSAERKKRDSVPSNKISSNPLDTFFQLITAKANASEIDLGLLTEATLISMENVKSSELL